MESSTSFLLVVGSCRACSMYRVHSVSISMNVGGFAYTTVPTVAMFLPKLGFEHVCTHTRSLFSLQAHDDRDELDVPVVAVPLHALQVLEVGLVEAHVLCRFRWGRVQAHNGWRVLHGDGLQAFDGGGGGGERTASRAVPEHAPEAVAPWRAPVSMRVLFIISLVCVGKRRTW